VPAQFLAVKQTSLGTKNCQISTTPAYNRKWKTNQNAFQQTLKDPLVLHTISLVQMIRQVNFSCPHLSYLGICPVPYILQLTAFHCTIKKK